MIERQEIENIAPGVNLSKEFAIRAGVSGIALKAFDTELDLGPDGIHEGPVGLREFIPGIVEIEDEVDIEIND